MRIAPQESLDKNQLLFDIWDGLIPRRVPLLPFIGHEAMLEYAGVCKNSYSSAKALLNAAEYLSGAIRSDIIPTVFFSSPSEHGIRNSGFTQIRCFSDQPEFCEIAARHKKATMPFCGFASAFPLAAAIWPSVKLYLPVASAHIYNA